MSERSTLVDNNSSGGLTLVYKGIKSVQELTDIAMGIAMTWKLYVKDFGTKENEGV